MPDMWKIKGTVKVHACDMRDMWNFRVIKYKTVTWQTCRISKAHKSVASLSQWYGRYVKFVRRGQNLGLWCGRYVNFRGTMFNTVIWQICSIPEAHSDSKSMKIQVWDMQNSPVTRKFKRDKISKKFSIKKNLDSKKTCVHITSHITSQVFFMQLTIRHKPNLPYGLCRTTLK